MFNQLIVVSKRRQIQTDVSDKSDIVWWWWGEWCGRWGMRLIDNRTVYTRTIIDKLGFVIYGTSNFTRPSDS